MSLLDYWKRIYALEKRIEEAEKYRASDARYVNDLKSQLQAVMLAEATRRK